METLAWAPATILLVCRPARVDGKLRRCAPGPVVLAFVTAMQVLAGGRPR